MANVTTMQDDLTVPSFHFHQTTFGQNIKLENNTTKAVRHTSFDHGILFDIYFRSIRFLFRYYIH